MSIRHTLVCLFLAALGAATMSSQWGGINEAPVVNIIHPANGGQFSWNTIIGYAVHVNDREDGNSDYDEIAPGEVIVLVHYLADSSTMGPDGPEAGDPIPAEVRRMSETACFNCHRSQGPLLGPSFLEISQRYQADTTLAEQLAQSVEGGSTGGWGELHMPPHPQLTQEEIKQMVSWILREGGNRHRSIHIGLEGAFRTREAPSRITGREVYLLTASYLDHGSREAGEHRIVGTSTVSLSARPGP